MAGLLPNGRLACDACDEPASHLASREVSPLEQRTQLRVCQDHHKLASDYKPLGREVDPAKKKEWLARAHEQTPEVKKAADILMSPDRDGSFHTRQLTHREKHPTPPGRDRTLEHRLDR